MYVNHDRIANEVGEASAALARSAPLAMKAYKAMNSAVYADGALARQTKEMIALALSVGARSEACVAYHARRLADLGAERAAVVEAVAVAMQMGGSPAMVHGGEAIRAFDSFRAAALAAA